jgi:hypothetical protein
MAICDGVRESSTEDDVFHLKGVRQGISTQHLPWTPRRLWLFFVLSCPRGGTFPCYGSVVNDSTDHLVFYAHVEPQPSFGPDGGQLITRAPLKCVFPEAGRYTVQIWFFQQQTRDILKGELSFLVTTEGTFHE